MQLCKVRGARGEARVGIVNDGRAHLATASEPQSPTTLSAMLHAADPLAAAEALLPHCEEGVALAGLELLPPLEEVHIRMTITRAGGVAFEGATSAAAMARTFEDLVSWLGRENDFPDGVILLTGTGVVPPDHFTLQNGDEIAIEVTGIGRLV